jgi:chromosome segregation protein
VRRSRPRSRAVRDAESARDAAHAARAGAESARQERAIVAGSARQAVLELQQQLAVAEERHRNAMSRRDRAAQERAEGAAFGDRVRGEFEAAQQDEQQCALALEAAAVALRDKVESEEQARAAVGAARTAADDADRTVREHRDRVRRLELERENAERELAEVAQRTEYLLREHEALAGVPRPRGARTRDRRRAARDGA